MTEPTLGIAVGTAFISGLVSSAHCIGMCGGISICIRNNTIGNRETSTDSTIVSKKDNWKKIITWLTPHGYRIGGYLFLTALFYQLFHLHKRSILPLTALGSDLNQITRGLLGLCLIIAAFSLLRQTSRRCQQCPKSKLKKPLRWLSRFWGMLPCPIVLAMLAASATLPNLTTAMVFMLVFGLGTLPAFLALSWSSEKILASNTGLMNRVPARLQRAAGIFKTMRLWQVSGFLVLIICGLWTLGSPWLMVHDQHHQHHHQHSQQKQARLPTTLDHQPPQSPRIQHLGKQGAEPSRGHHEH